MTDWISLTSREELERRLRAHFTEEYEVECILADALGYSRGEVGGPCPGSPVTGDHTVVTLAMEAAAVLERVSIIERLWARTRPQVT